LFSSSTKIGGNMQNNALEETRENPLSDLINDDTYMLLNSRGLINEKSVRDYKIRKKYKQLRDCNLSSSDAIDALRTDYPYLQFDTIRKIVYQIAK
jgi:hypothetical protein